MSYLPPLATKRRPRRRVMVARLLAVVAGLAVIVFYGVVVQSPPAPRVEFNSWGYVPEHEDWSRPPRRQPDVPAQTDWRASDDVDAKDFDRERPASFHESGGVTAVIWADPMSTQPLP